MATEAVFEILGFPGRMLSGSKGDYARRYPDRVVVFNGNVCVKSIGKIWFGDIDLTKDEANLKKLAAALNEDVYVLHEMDGRFSNEASPLLDKARAIISPAGEVSIKERQ